MKAVWIQWRRVLMTGFVGCCVMTGGTGDAVAAISTNSLKFEFLETTPGTHAATAVFTTDQDTILNTGTLTIELTNNSKAAVHSATDILLGVFFNSDVVFLPSHIDTSVTVPAGNTVHPGNSVGNPGDGWQVKSGISIHKGSNTYNSGIAAAGYGVFGPKGNLGPGPVFLDGSDYGIAGTDPTTGNGSIKYPIFERSLLFVLPFMGQLSLTKDDTIVFQYGTALNEPWFIGTDPIPGSPEPASVTLIMIGAVAVVLCRIRRSQAGQFPFERRLRVEG